MDGKYSLEVQEHIDFFNNILKNHFYVTIEEGSFYNEKFGLRINVIEAASHTPWNIEYCTMRLSCIAFYLKFYDVLIDGFLYLIPK